MKGDILTENDQKELAEKAKAHGASAAVWVPVPSIPTGLWTRMKCQFGCPSYGMTLCCPPYTPDGAFMKHFLAEYTESLLVQYTLPFHPDTDGKHWETFNRRMSNDMTRLVAALEKEAFLLGYYKAFGLKAGRCYLCDTCNLKHCVHPDLARPAAEACGIDIMALARSAGFTARILKGPVQEVQVYGLVLVE